MSALALVLSFLLLMSILPAEGSVPAAPLLRKLNIEKLPTDNTFLLPFSYAFPAIRTEVLAMTTMHFVAGRCPLCWVNAGRAELRLTGAQLKTEQGQKNLQEEKRFLHSLFLVLTNVSAQVTRFSGC